MGIFNLFGNKKIGRYASYGTGSGTRLKPYDLKVVGDRWLRITELLQAGKPSAAKQAVMEADKLLDYALTQVCSGTSLGERLKNAKDLFVSGVYQSLWDAHKFRNALVHETNFEPSQRSCMDAVAQIKAGLVELGAKI